MVLILISIPLTISLLLTNRSIQNYTVKEVASWLSTKTGGDIQVGSISYSPFAGISLHDVFMVSPAGDTIASLHELYADLSYRKLFQKQLLLHKVELNRPQFALEIDSLGKTNLQFLIDAFGQQQQPAQFPDWQFVLQDLTLKDGKIQIDQTNFPHGTNGYLDPYHILIDSINTQISGGLWGLDTAKLTIHQLSLQEKCGFKLQNLTFNGNLGKRNSSIETLDIQLPKSHLSFDSLQLNYDSLLILARPNDWKENGSFTVNLRSSVLHGEDFQNLTPITKNIQHSIQVHGNLGYKGHNLKLNDFYAAYGKEIKVRTNAELNGIHDFSNTYVYANIQEVSASKKEIDHLIQDFTGQTIETPAVLDNLGKITFSGNITGFFSDLVAYGVLTSDVGNIKTDIQLNYQPKQSSLSFKGRVGSEYLNLAKFLGEKSGLGSVQFDVMVDGAKPQNKQLNGTINGKVNSFTYNNYEFKDIAINGLYSEKDIDAGINYVDEKNGALMARFSFKEDSDSLRLSFKVNADTIALNPMKVIDKYPTMVFSLQLESQLAGTDVDDMNGFILLDSVSILNQKETLNPLPILITSTKSEGVQNIKVKSNLIQAEITGKVAFSTLANNLQYMIAKELPAIPLLKTEKQKKKRNNFNFAIQINPLSDFTYLFAQDWSIDDTTYINGYINDRLEQIEVTAYSNQIDLGKKSIDSLSLHLHNFQKDIQLHVGAIYETPLDTTFLNITSDIINNNVGLIFDFDNTVESEFSGQLKTNFQFTPPKRKGQNIDVTCSLLPSDLILADSLWQVKPGTIHFDEQSLTIDNLWFDGRNQYLKVNGQAVKGDKTQTIKASLKDIDLKYISEVFYMPEIKLLGIVTGEADVTSLFDQPIMNADVSAKQFGLNGHPLGDVIRANATYNFDKEQIDLSGDVVNATQDTSHVNGYISPTRQDMLLAIDINNLPLDFLEKYMVSFSNDVNGIAHGKLYVGGKLDKIDLWGDAYVKDAMISIDFLKTKYYFSDSIHLRKNAILFRDITLTDEYGHHGKIDGVVSHSHFMDLTYTIGIDVNNMLIFNTNEVNSPDFYGKIFATGQASIKGDVNSVNINVAAKPNKNSYFAIPINSYVDATDNKFITFITPKQTRLTARDRRLKRRQRLIEEITTKMKVNLAIEATPDIETQIILDSHTGDIIKAKGTGNIKIELDNNLNVRIYGEYDIQEGNYDFSIQGALRKRFEVGKGSSISFDGDPMTNCHMNINATYQTTASLAGLLEPSIIKTLKNSTVKVLCIARITGPLMSPNIKFDLELPSADEEVQRMVDAAINTEDMMSQQMVFLLLTGKFYNPTVMENTTNYSTQLAASFASATISGQINYWLSQISNNVNLGLNYMENSEESVENRQFDVSISTNFFDNRLILNGNIGYRNQYGSEDFIGDVELEYKLNRSGRLRLKAYNHTNDRLYSTSLYTQGLGIMYREDFDTWKNLGKYYKEVFRKRTPEEKAAAKEKKEKEKIQNEIRKKNKKILKEDRQRRHKIYVENEKVRKAALKAEKKAKKQAEKEAKKAKRKGEQPTSSPIQPIIPSTNSSEISSQD